MSLAYTLPVATSPVHGIYSFYDASGNDVSLFFNDHHLSGSVNGGSLATVFSTGTFDATWQCTDSLGFAYCASSARNPIIKTNGLTATALTVSSTGTMVTSTVQRLVTSGFSEAPSQINFSGANDFTNWTLGGLPTSPYTETINAPGSRITHITAACNGLMWFKETSFGILLNPDDALNAQNVILAPEIGTLDNSSVQYPGGLQFRAQDGHIYNFDCAGIQKLTRDIGSTIQTSGFRRANSWAVTSESDFEAGSILPTGSLSTTISPNDVIVSSFDVLLTTGSTFSQSVFIDSQEINNNSFESGTSNWDFSGGGGISVASSISTTNCGTIQAGSTGIDGSHFVFDKLGQVAMTFEFIDAVSSATLDSTSGSGNFTTCGGGLSSIQPATKRYGRIKVTHSGVSWYSDRFVTDGNRIFFDSGSDFCGTGWCTWWDYIHGSPRATVARSSGTYYSSVHNAPAFTSWDTLGVTKQDNAGTHTFYVRGSTNPFTVLSSTPAWVNVFSGGLISATTGVYQQFRDDFYINAATQTPTLNDFTLNWFEGTSSDKPYAVYFGKDNSIWWSVAAGSGQSSNNRILRWDLLNNGWVLYDIAANGFIVRNQSLYIGSATAGKIYRFGDADSDDGAAINSYWKSKDFSGDSPTVDKDFRTISLIGKSVANSSMLVTYTTNASSSTAYTVSLYNANSSILRNNRYLPLTVGNTFNLKFANNAADQYWELFGVSFGYKQKPWMVGN